MKQFLKNLVLASSLVLAGTASAGSVNLVKNGSFENPDIASGTWTVVSSADGWSTFGAGLEIRDNVVGSAYDGEQFAELDSHSWSGQPTNSGIFQTLTTEVGKQYQLSFAYSPRIGTQDTTNGISVFWNGFSLANVQKTSTSKSHEWTVFSFLVTGTGSDELKFAATGTDDSYGGSLDAVSVSAVPVPAAAFLMAPALIGFMGLRRKAVKKA
jgi:hypothetical protein